MGEGGTSTVVRPDPWYTTEHIFLIPQNYVSVRALLFWAGLAPGRAPWDPGGLKGINEAHGTPGGAHAHWGPLGLPGSP